jgi:tetratricopeptide (TPR) repeat protein
MVDRVIIPDQPAVVISSRYQVFDKLGEGGMGTVYRALDRLTGQMVALKRMISHRQKLKATPQSDTAILAQEFKFLASLRHPHIISVLDYGVDGFGQPFYTMTLIESAQELGLIASQRDLNGKIDLLLQMLQALAYLHRRGILHRDLKPANVLVDEQGQVKVVDFGLATFSGQQNTPAGTLAYMAPEILRGESAVPQSDLYAIGIMAYEFFAGRRPFAGSNAIALIYNAVYEPLDVSVLAIDPTLILIIRRLLAPSIDDRYASADAVMQALADVIGQPLILETKATRESFLQAAQFVGRETELSALNGALIAAENYQGSLWLIGGESGVGKSRLLEEVQIQAMLRGALVLRGQAVAEGAAPYQVWREAIRRLVLQVELTDFQASVLKPILPDIGELLGRDIADLPAIDVVSLQIRLRNVISLLFSQKQLIVLLLEDLQWVDESLLILKWLLEQAKDKQLLIVATYRDDEHHTLPDQYPGSHHIKLSRLTSEAIAQLSASMLGDGGKSTSILKLLERETEGNVFFIVEVVRTLAEEAGGLANVGHKTLPEQIFAGGMQTVIKRRLDKVPESARHLMTAAAIFGRELDLGILAVMMSNTADVNFTIDAWLQQVATVIEADGDRYRFAHDKLREAILANLSTSERRRYHWQIAEGIEHADPDSPERYAMLAYHWGQAQNAEKTIHNAILAGQHLLHTGSYREALQFFEQALAFTEQSPLDNQALSNLYHLLGDAHWGYSDLSASVADHTKALQLLGFAVPQNRQEQLLGVVRPLLHHIGRRLFRIKHRTQDRSSETLIIVGKAFHQLAQSTYRETNIGLGVFCIFNGLDVIERAGNSRQAVSLQAQYYSSLGLAMADIGLRPIAGYYFRLALACLHTDTESETLSWVKFPYGLYLGASGHWPESAQLFDEVIRINKASGNIGLWSAVSHFRASIYCFQGQFSEAEAYIDTEGQIVTQNSEIQSTGRFLLDKARILFLKGHTSEAKTVYIQNEAAIEKSLTLGDHTIGRIFANGFLTELYVRLEAWDDALKAGELLNKWVAKSQSISFFLAGETAASILLYLTLWEKHKQSPEADKYQQMAATMLKLYHRKYARLHPIGLPIEYMYCSWYASLEGNPHRAERNGVRAIRLAQTHHMPYYEALSRYHLARFMGKDDPERLQHLKSAAAIFDRIGASYDAEQVYHCI